MKNPGTARVVVIYEGKILLIERWRGQLHYFSFPGGHIEPGETPAQTAAREVKEETGVDVKIGLLIYKLQDAGHTHYFYLADFVRGTPALSPDSEEFQQNALGQNRFEPKWVAVNQIGNLPFNIWQPVASQLASDLKTGLGEQTKKLSA